MSGKPPTNEPQFWLPSWPKFIWEQEIARITPATYNPRFLSEEAFERLCASIGRFGVIKPIILNADDTILAGHQRTKAMASLGMETTPAAKLANQANADAEVHFNLQHNSVEEADCEVVVPPREEAGYHWVRHQDIRIKSLGRSAQRIGVTSRMLAKHGPWGSAVADAAGNVIANSDYAAAVKKLRVPLLVHYNSGDAKDLQAVLDGDFGIYDASQAALTPYVQTMLQRFRLRYPKDKDNKPDWRDRSEGSFRSTTWEQHCLPWLTKQHKVLDFGAGRMDYALHLQKDGYDVQTYEPFFIHVDEETRELIGEGRHFDVAAIAKMILLMEKRVRAGELYDVIILDSVINATATEDFQKAIFTTLAALLKPGGRMVMGTLGLRSASMDYGSARVNQARTKYLGEHNRAVSYHDGVMYAVKYHTEDTLREALSPHFADIALPGHADAGQLHAICRKPKVAEPADLIWALDQEFNMEYPGGYRHRAERGLLEAVLAHHYPDVALDSVLPERGTSADQAGKSTTVAPVVKEDGAER